MNNTDYDNDEKLNDSDSSINDDDLSDNYLYYSNIIINKYIHTKKENIKLKQKIKDLTSRLNTIKSIITINNYDNDNNTTNIK